MAKGNFRFPHLHAKTAILAALVLALPLTIIVASSPKLNETRSNASTASYGGGGVGIPGCINIQRYNNGCQTGYSCKTISNSSYCLKDIKFNLRLSHYDRAGTVKFTWDKVPNVKYYEIYYYYNKPTSFIGTAYAKGAPESYLNFRTTNNSYEEKSSKLFKFGKGEYIFSVFVKLNDGNYDGSNDIDLNVNPL